MGKSLVIVESPAKAKTINKYLGKDFVVKSSVGHIRDLPTSGSTKAIGQTPDGAGKQTKAFYSLVRRMGVDPENGWEAHYEVLPGKEKVLEDLQKLAADADMVYLATDLDREGEAIAWHLREVIGGGDDRFKRVTFSEITKNAIQAAFEHPGELNMDRVNAQQARRFLDRVVGFMLSPLLWKKVARGLSAGRVQSVATRLVVEREREIKAFIPEEYWELHADLKAGGDELRAEVVKQAGEPFKPKSEADVTVAVKALEPATYRVAKREDKPTRSRAPAPFITSSLQRAASTRLGFSVKRTMNMAQRLYEAGYITYMRTDSRNLSGDAIGSIRAWITKQYGERYLPEKAQVYASGDGAQEAHEAIRPTDVRLEPDDLDSKGVEPEQKRLYDLIWRQTVACQMPSAEYDTTALTIEAAGYDLRARGRTLRFDGWMKVMPPAKKKGDEDSVLPDLREGAELALVALDPAQHFTKPPARYNEASLVTELEKRSIGRPSTYASIISTIQDRGYVRQENRRMYAEKMGEIVTDRLVENFDRILDYGFTAELEEELDKVAGGELVWKTVLDEFYAKFTAKLKHAEEDMRGNTPVEVPEITCPDCGRVMAIRTARTGVFMSCTGYALSKKEGKCTKTINLVSGDEAETVSDEDDELAQVNALREKRRCPKCGTAMDSWLVDEQRKLHVCGNNPDCDGHEVEQGQFKIKGYDGPVIECDKCGADMQLRSGRFGKYFGCTADDCKNTRKLLRSGEAAPPKIDPIPMPELKCTKADDHFVLRDGAAGVFLAAASYPRVRETRNPLVSELLPHAAELPDKYQFLAEAPVQDPDGNPMVVRFARKTKEHYVAGDADGKPSGHVAHCEGGTWVLKAAEKKAPAKKKAGAKKKSASKKKAAAKKRSSEEE